MRLLILSLILQNMNLHQVENDAHALALSSCILIPWESIILNLTQVRADDSKLPGWKEIASAFHVVDTSNCSFLEFHFWKEHKIYVYFLIPRRSTSFEWLHGNLRLCRITCTRTSSLIEKEMNFLNKYTQRHFAEHVYG